MRIKNVNTIPFGKIYIFTIFTILIPVLTILLAVTSVSCSNKNIEPNYNKNLTVDVLPSYNRYFNDYTGKIPRKWADQTEQLIIELETKTSCEIGVAFIQDLNGLSIEEYAALLFEKWGIGKKQSDNGVLLLASLKDRSLRIEVGYGLEEVITDIEAKEIIDDIIVPAFREDQYGPGIYNGVAALANSIYEDMELVSVELVEIEKKVPFTQTWGFPFLIIFANIAPWLIIGFIFLRFSLKSYIREHRCPNCRRIGLTVKRRFLVSPTYEYPGRQEVVANCKYCGYQERNTVTVAKKRKPGTSGGYSGSSGSGFSGSFSSGSGSHSSSSSGSSFGGGSSGGGGASGSW
jgi:uncharacterized protein